MLGSCLGFLPSTVVVVFVGFFHFVFEDTLLRGRVLVVWDDRRAGNSIVMEISLVGAERNDGGAVTGRQTAKVIKLSGLKLEKFHWRYNQFKGTTRDF